MANSEIINDGDFEYAAMDGCSLFGWGVRSFQDSANDTKTSIDNSAGVEVGSITKKGLRTATLTAIKLPQLNPVTVTEGGDVIYPSRDDLEKFNKWIVTDISYQDSNSDVRIYTFTLEFREADVPAPTPPVSGQSAQAQSVNIPDDEQMVGDSTHVASTDDD